VKRQERTTWFQMAKRRIIACTIDRIARWVDRAVAWLDGAPNLRVIPRFFRMYDTYQVNSLAAEIAFYLLLAIFPFMIFVVSLAGLIGRSTFLSPAALDQLKDLFPSPVYDLLHSFLDGIVTNGTLTLISLSMLGIIWSASSGLSVLLKGLLRIHGRGLQVNVLLMRGLGLLMTFGLVLAMVINIVLVTFGDLFLDVLAQWTGNAVLAGPYLAIARYLATFIFLGLFFSLLYFLVARRPVQICQILPGAIFAATAWMILSQGFSWYVTVSSRYALIYGSLVGMVILMLWLYFCSIVMLTGGILNVLLQALHEEKNTLDVPDRAVETIDR
jgi:membrane protein